MLGASMRLSASCAHYLTSAVAKDANTESRDMNIRELGYIVLDATNLSAWAEFSSKALGAMVKAGTDNNLHIRIDDRDCRLLVQKAEVDRLHAIGWLLRDQDSFEEALADVKSRGLEPVMGSEAQCQARRITEFFAVTDPAGHRHEIAWGPVVNFLQPFVSPVGVSKFHTNEQGLGHLVIGCELAQYEASGRFLREVLGLKLANFRKQSVTAMPVKMPIGWFHCDNSRQHSIGLAACIEPGGTHHGLRHINLEVSSIDELGRAYDRAPAHGAKIARTMGRHVNDRAISFYMESPSGFLFEYGCDAPPVNWNEQIAYDEGGIGSIWGHQWVS